MIDVDEVYKLKHSNQTKSSNRQAAAAIDQDTDITDRIAESTDASSLAVAEASVTVKVNEYKSLSVDANFLVELKTKQTKYYHRHLDQCFIRGDNVVLVAYAD